MGEWIRHRGSKSMPKRLEGMRFEVRQRNGEVHKIDSEVIGILHPESWANEGWYYEVIKYRILGPIGKPDWPEDRVDVIGQNGNTGEHYAIDTKTRHVTPAGVSVLYDAELFPPTNKYQRTTKGVTIDVYDVLVAFGVTCPAMAHAIKKMLMPGQRGIKDAEQDKREAIQAIERSIELSKGYK